MYVLPTSFVLCFWWKWIRGSLMCYSCYLDAVTAHKYFDCFKWLHFNRFYHLYLYGSIQIHNCLDVIENCVFILFTTYLCGLSEKLCYSKGVYIFIWLKGYLYSEKVIIDWWNIHLWVQNYILFSKSSGVNCITATFKLTKMCCNVASSMVKLRLLMTPHRSIWEIW